jgi:hypothetical protein
LFQEFVEASDLGLGGAAALRSEVVVAAAVTLFGFWWALSFANFDDEPIFEEALNEAV